MKKIDDVECARSLLGRAREAEQNEETAKAKGLYDDALAQFADDSLDPLLPEVLVKGTLMRRTAKPSRVRCYTRSLERRC
jgi:hypothetical protein